jgi:DNA-binding NarL/FixJ family response regulator
MRGVSLSEGPPDGLDATRGTKEGQGRPSVLQANGVGSGSMPHASSRTRTRDQASAALVGRTDWMRSRTRVFLAHQQLIVAESLRIALGREPDIEVVGVQTTMDLVEEQVVQSGADVLLLDATIDTARLTVILNAVRTTARSIVLAQDDDLDLLQLCVSAGAVGHLVGPRALPELMAAIRHAHHEWVVLTPQQVASLIDQAPWRTSTARAAEICSRLSARERDVLQILATGATNDEIATRLLISANTVQSHLKNVLRKLNVRSKLAAVVMALSAGVIEAPDA